VEPLETLARPRTADFVITTSSGDVQAQHQQQLTNTTTADDSQQFKRSRLAYTKRAPVTTTSEAAVASQLALREQQARIKAAAAAILQEQQQQVAARAESDRMITQPLAEYTVVPWGTNAATDSAVDVTQLCDTSNTAAAELLRGLLQFDASTATVLPQSLHENTAIDILTPVQHDFTAYSNTESVLDETSAAWSLQCKLIPREQDLTTGDIQSWSVGSVSLGPHIHGECCACTDTVITLPSPLLI
jgi:hypothetical protein